MTHPGKVGRIVGVLAALFPAAALAQQPMRAQVVQIAGANLYLDVGTDAGVHTGDTLSVRRGPASPPVGACAVIAATSGRSVVAFVGTPFPATRGDTLYVTPGNLAVAAPPVATPQARAPAARVIPYPARSAARMDGAIGFEMWGARTTTLGLGTDPVRTTQDVATPAVRFRTRLAPTGSSEFNLNLRAQRRAGPPGLFDRANTVRIYEARFDQTAGPLKFSLGRFFSDFDHASGYWDGGVLRVGRERGLSAGVAGGFEPALIDDAFSTDVPKVAAFVAARTGTASASLASDLAFHQTLPRNAIPKRRLVDWSLRVNSGRLGLAQEIEASPDSGNGSWSITRYIVRASAPLLQGLDVYGSAISDRPLPVDTGFVVPLERRERVTAGLSYQARRLYADVNGTINGPRETTRGYAAGAMVALPNLIGAATFAVNGSYFTSGGNRGVIASPSIEYRLGGSRVRAGYQFLLNEGASYSVMTHGGDLRFSQSISSRIDWVMQFNLRYGANLRSTGGYSSLEVRF